MKLNLKAPAKLNLCLKIAGLRPDGFHELVSLMQPIDLCDRISLETGGDGLEFTCNIKPLQGDHNLVLKAARAWFKQAGINPAAKIHLDKQVPMAAGIGGGSSDAAAMLLGLNALHQGRLEPQTLFEIAAGLGSDVPFFLAGVTSWCTGRGELIKPWPEFPLLNYVVVNPGIEVPTPWVYKTYDLHWTKQGRANTINGLRGYLETDWNTVMVNDLEAVTAQRYPVVNRIKWKLMAAGAQGALMSGSGSTVFGVFETMNEAAKVADKLAQTEDLWVRACQGLSC
jgi:4-diphosphocytidyl-2-C-methyl-D-erythritol kinase